MSETNNPYLAPGATLDGGAAGATYEPRVFAWRGRIGRVRYMAYLSMASLLSMPVVGVGGALLALMMPTWRSNAELVPLLMVVLYIPLLVYCFALARRRFNDLDRSGWFILLMLVPIVNVLASLYLLFAPGTDGPNEYGLPPSKNSTLVIIGGCLLPLIFVVGILAAIAIPAYQDYTTKAKAARSSSSF